ncbi:putative tRNA (uracil-O(2)-)-methyltransferase [Cyberlindnera fabianii]|nr:putative tRNA (uracil-O(2)-)-methyltransferase [Cyberlindnera fabianii]
MRFRLNGPGLEFNQYPPTYICEILPPGQFSVLNLGDFTIADSGLDKLVDYQLELEEEGMYPKVDLEFRYIDFKNAALTNGNSPLYYSMTDDDICPVPDAERDLHVAIETLIDRGIKSPHLPTMLSDTDITNFYTSGSRSVKMMNPNAQKSFKEVAYTSLRPWKVPF